MEDITITEQSLTVWRGLLFHYKSILLGTLILVGLYLSSLYSYLLFHSLAEGFSIVVACSVFMLAWNSRRLLTNDYLLFLGIAYLFVAILDFVHTLGYKGMAVFSGYDTNLATQLWIAARYLESLSLLCAPLFIRRKLKPGLMISGYAVFVTLVLVFIFGGIFPICFIEAGGAGLTPFKKISEYLISLILVGSAVTLYRRRNELDRRVLQLVIASIAVTIGSEMAFTFYVHAYGLSNLIGHYLKIVSFYLIYKAIIQTGLIKPYSLMFRDLKRSEEALRRSRETLETRVKKRTKELIIANEHLQSEIDKRKKAGVRLKRTLKDLERSNKELEQFAYVASHDLQEPLRMVSSYTQLLEKRYKGQLDQDAKEFINYAVDGANRMQRLIQDLLAYSRVGTRGKPLKPTDCNAVLGQARANLSVVIEENNAVVTHNELPTVMADDTQLVLVFQNLIANAVRFRTEELPRVHVSAEQNSKEWIFSVRDNGKGIAPEFHERIFVIFQCLQRDEKFAGTGIGLAICKRIVERHGGRIWVESQPAQGSTFYFTVPRKGGK